MSSFYRSNLYGNNEDPDEGVDGYDMSGFLGDTPQTDEFSETVASEQGAPRVTQRPRGGSSNASGTVGYVVPQPIHVDTTEPGIVHYISPFWADDNGLAPRVAAVTKSAGVTTMVLAGTYALAKRSSGGSAGAEVATIAGCHRITVGCFFISNLNKVCCHCNNVWRTIFINHISFKL